MLAGWPEGGPGRYHVIENRPGRGTAGRHRTPGPVTEGIDGIVSMTRMRAADHAYLVVVLAESMDAFDAASQAIMSTELLPGEDPELLGGPDRISFYRLVHADLPITEGSPA
jgi:hypothetical protein